MVRVVGMVDDALAMNDSIEFDVANVYVRDAVVNRPVGVTAIAVTVMWSGSDSVNGARYIYSDVIEGVPDPVV